MKHSQHSPWSVDFLYKKDNCLYIIFEIKIPTLPNAFFQAEMSLKEK